MKVIKILFPLYILVIVFLFFYSFTQVDLSLTLSRWSVWQVAQRFFQHIGYFERPLSAALYVSILVSLYVFYLLFLFLVKKNKIKRRYVWFLIIAQTTILAFSYNAFSYDLFNYIFDAKIVTFYHQNPYLHKALDFSSDPMLSFMHWTHRLYPYGPVWLALTVPLSFLGWNFFLPTFFLFKFLTAASYLGVAYFIDKIAHKILPKDELFALAFFALNPLVIIESLVSGHNDITMLFFSIMAFYLFLTNRNIRSFIVLAISIGVKFVSIFLFPVFLSIFLLKTRKKSINWFAFIFVMAVAMTFAVVVASVRTNFQPWYLLYPLPFTALISRKYYVLVSVVLLSFFAMLQYVPFLYLGNWDKPVPTILSWMTTITIILSLMVILVYFLKRKSIGKT